MAVRFNFLSVIKHVFSADGIVREMQDSGSSKEVDELTKQNDDLKERLWQTRHAKDELEADMTKKQVRACHSSSY